MRFERALGGRGRAWTGGRCHFTVWYRVSLAHATEAILSSVFREGVFLVVGVPTSNLLLAIRCCPIAAFRSSAFAVSNSTIVKEEIPGTTPSMTVSAAFLPVPPSVQVTAASPQRQFLAVLKTSLVEEGAATAAAPWAAAEAEYRALLSVGPSAITRDHVNAWVRFAPFTLERFSSPPSKVVCTSLWVCMGRAGGDF